MAEAFPVSGNIEPASFPHLLVDLHRHGATGSLKVTGPVHPKALYFRGGRILFGSSNDPRDQLGAILIESGRITREQLDEVNAKVGPGNPLAKVLAESGFVNQRELGDAARVKVERILADVLSWDSGTFEFEDGVLPKGAVDLKLSTERLLLAAVQRVPDRSFALRHVDLSTVLEPEPAGEAALSEVRAEVWPLLERLDGTRTLKDAIALTRLDEFEAAKTACAMLFLGVLRRRAGGGEELDLAQEAQSGFGAEPAPMYTVPIEAIREASLPDFRAHGLRLLGTRAGLPCGRADLRHRAAGARREPGRDRHAPGRLRGAASRSPRFSPPSRPRSPRPRASRWTLRGRARPPTRCPATGPSTCPPPEPEPADEPAAYAPVAPSIPEIPPAPAQASRPTQEDLAALDALLNPSASGQLGKSPVERPRPEKWEPQFRPPTTPPRKAPARPAASSSPSRVPFSSPPRSAASLSRPWPRGTSSCAPRPPPGPARCRRRRRPRPRRRPRWPPPRPRRPRPSSSRPRPQRRLRCRARRPRPRRSRHHRRRPLRVPRRPRVPRPLRRPAPVAPAGRSARAPGAGRARRCRPCVRGLARARAPAAASRCRSSWPARRRTSRRP